MTGYTREEALGRNCRFLQGEATDAAALGRLRQAMQEGRESTVELLNYRKVLGEGADVRYPPAPWRLRWFPAMAQRARQAATARRSHRAPALARTPAHAHVCAFDNPPCLHTLSKRYHHAPTNNAHATHMNLHARRMARRSGTA